MAGSDDQDDARVPGKFRQGADRDDRQAHGWLEASTPVNDCSNGRADKLQRSQSSVRIAGVQPACALDVLVAGGGDVAARVDARGSASQGIPPTLVDLG